VKKQLQESGDLEGMLASEKEIEVFKAGNTDRFSAEGPVPQELSSACNIYDNAKRQLQDNYEKERVALKRELVTAIRAIQTMLTQKGRFDEAVEVREYADGLVNEIAATSNQEAQAPMLTPIGVSSGGRVTFKMQVDGTSHMYIQGDSLWYEHTKGKASAVELNQGEHPTHIDGEEWMPKWSNKVTSKHDADLGLPMSGPGVEFSVKMIEGLGHATVSEQPGPDNDYTAKLALHDVSLEGKRFRGSRWIEFELTW